MRKSVFNRYSNVDTNKTLEKKFSSNIKNRFSVLPINESLKEYYNGKLYN